MLGQEPPKPLLTPPTFDGDSNTWLFPGKLCSFTLVKEEHQASSVFCSSQTGTGTNNPFSEDTQFSTDRGRERSHNHHSHLAVVLALLTLSSWGYQTSSLFVLSPLLSSYAITASENLIPYTLNSVWSAHVLVSHLPLVLKTSPSSLRPTVCAVHHPEIL